MSDLISREAAKLSKAWGDPMEASRRIRALATSEQRDAFDKLVSERVAAALAKRGEPVAWQWRSKIGPSGWGSGALSISDPGEMNDQYEKRPLYAHPSPASAGVTVKPLEWDGIEADDDFARLLRIDGIGQVLITIEDPDDEDDHDDDEVNVQFRIPDAGGITGRLSIPAQNEAFARSGMRAMTEDQIRAIVQPLVAALSPTAEQGEG